MSDERRDRMERQISEIHTTVFGVDGQGGLHRWLEKVDKDVDDLKTQKHKALGVIAGLTLAFEFIGHKFGSIFK